MNFGASEEVLITKKDAARRLKVSPRTIDRYLANETLPPVRLSTRATRIRLSDIEALLSKETALSPALAEERAS